MPTGNVNIVNSTREWRVPDPATTVDELQLKDAPIPALKATDVLVKVHAVSLQFRDLLVATAKYPLPAKKGPVLGSDAAGEIVAVGAEVEGWNVGDRVCSNFARDHIFGAPTHASLGSALGAPVDGVLTTYKVLPAHGLVRIPEHLSYEEASTLPCAAVTAYNALFSGFPLKGGDYVLIEGTGGVSIFALQFALAVGAVPIVITSSKEKIEAACKLGAEHIINYREVENWEEEVLKLTGGVGVDHVVEVTGSQTLAKAFKATRFGGTISAIGFLSGIANEVDTYIECLTRAIILRGVLVGSRTEFENMNRLIAARKIQPVVDKVFPFEELPAALKYLESQKHVGKVVVRVAE